MNLRDWEIIHALYERKNITRAARTLFISQPALTARVKQIEEYFGCQIILRERRGIQFTPEGEYLAKQAVNVLKQQEQIRSDVLSMKDNLGGTLKLGASNFFSKYKLPKILGDFRKIYPNVEFQVLSGWSEDIYRKMADRDVHVGFIRGDYPWRGRRDVLFEETLCVASTEPFEWDDLHKMTQINYKTDRKLIALVEDWWNENFDYPPNVGLRVDQVDTCKEMIINGLGYGIVPDLIVDDDPSIYKKTLKNPDGEPIIRKTWMYYDQDSVSVNTIGAFLRYIHSIDVKRL